MKKVTDTYFLYKEIYDTVKNCVPNDGDSIFETPYYYNGQYYDFGMDVKEMKNPIFGY